MTVSANTGAHAASWTTMNGQPPHPAPSPDDGATRLPAHLRPALIGLVALGGAAGSAARYGVEMLLPGAELTGGWPLATLAVNLLGAFALGFGLEALARRGRETPRLRNIRLAGGTGLLGGFTTYSAFALQVHGLLTDAAAGTAVAYVLVTLVLGVLCCLSGVLLGERAGAGRRAAPAAASAEGRR